MRVAGFSGRGGRNKVRDRGERKIERGRERQKRKRKIEILERWIDRKKKKELEKYRSYLDQYVYTYTWMGSVSCEWMARWVDGCMD